MEGFSNAGSGAIIRDVAATIVAAKVLLSDLDGKIGDGDHGVNMAKGFGRAADRISDDASLSEAMAMLSDVLMSEIGGSMGPLYGTFFGEMAESLNTTSEIDSTAFAAMLRAGLDGVAEIGSASIGDKTMMDALVPAVEACEAAAASGMPMPAVLGAAVRAAEAGRDATRDMVAKVGRASRLGERSRGFLDAGAVSCALILRGLCEGANSRLEV